MVWVDVLIISNPNSTSMTQRHLASIIPTLRRVPGIRMLSRYTQYPGHAEELARQARTQAWDAVIAIGGDGTVNEVMNGVLAVPAEPGKGASQSVLMRNAPVVGIIPTGSANVFARALGFSPRSDRAVRQLAAALRQWSTRTTGLGLWSDASDGCLHDRRWFAVNAGYGIDADVIQEMEKRRAEGLSASPLHYMKMGVKLWAQGKTSAPAVQVHTCVDSPAAKDAATDEEQGTEEHNSQEHHYGKRSSGTHPFVKGTPAVPLIFVSHTDPWTYWGPLPVHIAPRGSMEKGLSLFSLRTTRGWRPIAALIGLLWAPLRRPLRGETLRMHGVQEVDLRVDAPRGFQVDGEFQGEYSAVHLSFIPHAVEVLVPPSQQ